MKHVLGGQSDSDSSCPNLTISVTPMPAPCETPSEMGFLWVGVFPKGVTLDERYAGTTLYQKSVAVKLLVKHMQCKCVYVQLTFCVC